jgi:hypothetical protein
MPRAIACLRNDLGAGHAAPNNAQRLAKQWLIVGDEGRGAYRHPPPGKLIPGSAVARLVRVSCSSPPNASFNRRAASKNPVPRPDSDS